MADKYTALVKEKRDNESTITRLQARNKAIGDLIKQIDKLAGGPPSTEVRRKPLNEIAKQIIEIMDDGRTRNINKLGTRVLGHVPVGTECKMIANYCRGLTNRGHLTRVGHGQYKKLIKQTTNIGSDTRITQIPPKANGTDTSNAEAQQ